MLPGRYLLCSGLVLAVCVALSGAVGITDLVWWGADMLANSGADGEQRESAVAEGGAGAPAGPGAPGGPKRTCHCSGPACMCCLDFNMTYIDLGGPGCVRLRYLGQDAGVAMNVSYGESLLHSEVVKDSSPSGTCMDILSSLAQVCARFSSLEQLEMEGEAEGNPAKRGCLQLEPTLLGETQATYPVGCFRMTPQSMTLEPQSVTPAPAPAVPGQPEGEGTSTTESPASPSEISAESLIAAVSETAEQGIDLLTNWLGLALEEDSNSTATDNQDVSSTAAPSEDTSARSFGQNTVLLH